MNTPTPKTDAAWAAESGNGLNEVKEISRKLERELTAMTEQRDEAWKEIDLLKTNLRIQTEHTENAVQDRADEHIELHNQIHELTEQRDRLIEQQGQWRLSSVCREYRKQLDRLAEALQKLADCDWVITLPDRMDAVREIANEALQSLNKPTETK